MPAYARELAEWSGEAFAALGYEETEDEKRYRRAACLVADISWRAHPDYRGSQALNMISNASLSASIIPDAPISRSPISSGTRVLPTAGRIRTRRHRQSALARVFEGSRSGHAYHLSVFRIHVKGGPEAFLKTTAEGLELVIDKSKADLIGDVPEGRLQQLARLTGKNIRMVIS